MKYQTKETALVIKSWDDLPYKFSGVINYFGNYHWYLNGKKHRDDGPALIYFDGSKVYYFNDFYSSQEEWFEFLTPRQKEKAIWNMDNW